MAYTYTDLAGKEATLSTDGIDFLIGTREVCKEASASDNNTDLLFTTDSRTFFRDGLEYGSYVPEDSIVKEGKTTSVGGYSGTSTTAADLKDKTLSEVIDGILFPETDAVAGTVPVRTISNSGSYYVEVGTIIPTVTASTSTAAKDCQYILDGTTYKTASFSFTGPTVTQTLELDGTTVSNGTTSKFGAYTRSTAATSYTVTGPAATTLRDSKYLYKSRGTSTTIQPAQIGTSSAKSIAATSATVYGVYKGGKEGKQVTNLWVRSDGYVSASQTSGYNTSLSYAINTDTASTTDHNFGTVIGTHTVELPTAYSAGFTVKLTATKYNASTKAFEEDTDLTTQLNALTVTTNTTTPGTFQDASKVNYNVTSYSINASSVNVSGKFIVNISITKK